MFFCFLSEFYSFCFILQPFGPTIDRYIFPLITTKNCHYNDNSVMKEDLNSEYYSETEAIIPRNFYDPSFLIFEGYIVTHFSNIKIVSKIFYLEYFI